MVNRKLGNLPTSTKETIETLNLQKLEALAIALFDFETIADLEIWLTEQADR